MKRRGGWILIGTFIVAGIISPRPAMALFRMRLNGAGVCSSRTPTYNGGPVLSHVSVVAVFWSSSVSTTIQAGIPGFYNAITDNQWMDVLEEYYSTSPHLDPVGRGSFYSFYTITPTTNHGKSGQPRLTDTDIGTELATQINNGVLPVPGANTLYMLYFPQNFAITIGGANSCSSWCGVHTFTTQTIDGVSTQIPYGVIPDQSSSGCMNGCSSGTAFQQTTITSSHEMAEAITDPFIAPTATTCTTGNSWCPEIGDPCGCKAAETITDIGGNTFSVQPIWHVDSNSCSENHGLLCGRSSNAYGNSTQSQTAAPNEAQQWFGAAGCSTFPRFPTNTCQNVADMFAWQGDFNFMAPETQTWFSDSCFQEAQDFDQTACQAASDDYGIVANVTWGSAPSYVRTWWTNNGCTTAPHGLSACQKAADLYGFAPGTTGFAPTDIQQKWTAYGCYETTTSTVGELCQNIANLYGTVPGVTWGIAPAPTQNWWTANGCFVNPTCQGISDLLGATPWSAGIASSTTYAYYQNNGCTTTPQLGGNLDDLCQLVADNFSATDTGVNTQYSIIGFLPDMASWDEVVWWENSSCHATQTYHPRYNRRVQFTPGP